MRWEGGRREGEKREREREKERERKRERRGGERSEKADVSNMKEQQECEERKKENKIRERDFSHDSCHDYLYIIPVSLESQPCRPCPPQCKCHSG